MSVHLVYKLQFSCWSVKSNSVGSAGRCLKSRLKRWNVITISSRSWDMSNSGWRPPNCIHHIRLTRIVGLSIELLHLENVVSAFGISFLSHLEAEIEVIPPYWSFYFRFGPDHHHVFVFVGIPYNIKCRWNCLYISSTNQCRPSLCHSLGRHLGFSFSDHIPVSSIGKVVVEHRKCIAVVISVLTHREDEIRRTVENSFPLESCWDNCSVSFENPIIIGR